MQPTSPHRLQVDPRAKGLIFDLDGTLLDSMPLHWKAWYSACAHYGAQVEREFFFRHVGKSMSEIASVLIDQYHIDARIEDITKLKDELVYAEMDGVRRIEPVVAIATANYGVRPMSIGTGSNHRRAELMLQNAGILHYFAAIVCAEDVVNHKPSPDTFLRCAELMGVEPHECQVFEDGEPGLNAALAAGMIATDIKPFYDS